MGLASSERSAVFELIRVLHRLFTDSHDMTDAPAIRPLRPAIPAQAWIVLVVMALIGISIALGGRVIAQQFVSGLMLGAIYLTVAVAFTLTIGVLNFLNFTIPSLFMLTGMVAWGLTNSRTVAFAGGWAWLVRFVRPRPWIAASAFHPGSSR